MKLSRHFVLDEFTKSQTAIRKRINNTPSPQVISNLRALCENVLEPVRLHFKRPVIISSGYRSPALNREIGGAMNSQHATGEAADFEIIGVDNCDLTKWIQNNLRYDQLILEFHNHEEGPNSGWVHASFSSTRNRFQNLTVSSTKMGTRTTMGFPWSK